MREVELSDREAEEVYAKRDAAARHPLPIAAEEPRAFTLVVGDAGIREQRHFDRHRPVHRLRHAKGPEQREAEFDIPDQHPAAEQAVVLRTRALRVRMALAGVERVDVVTANEVGI